MSKRLLSLDDLYTYYSKYKKSTHFSVSDTKSPLVVQVQGTVKFDETDSNTEGLKPVILKANHTKKNINGSNIEDSVALAALPSFSNRPILGYIHKVDGQFEFWGHNIHEDEDGEIVYDEIPVGIIPESCEAKLEYDEEQDKNYVVVKGYLFDEYSKAGEILEREQECSVSVELSIRELSYNAKEKYLDIENYYYSGVTILGKTDTGETVNPGMVGSNIKLADFSAENNGLVSDVYEQRLIEMQEKINSIISRFNIDINQGKEEIETLNKFDELLEKYNKTKEDITFEYEGLSDEELEAKFVEMFGEPSDNSDGEVSEVNEEDISEEVEDENNESDEVNDESNEDNNNKNENFSSKSIKSVDENGKMTISYEISHEDVRYALYNLLTPYEEVDNEWYCITAVYDTYFVYQNWSGNKIYGQKYDKDGDNISFGDNERYVLHKELLTDSEYAELQAMRANYAELKQFKADTEYKELHSQREAVLANNNYSSISETETDAEGKVTYKNAAFGKLVAEMDNYSVEELEKEAKVILADYITNGGNFSAVVSDKKTVNKKMFAITDKKTKNSRYGSLKFN